MDKVIIFDTTLRDGEQAAGGSMNIQEKLEIARQLDALGADVIEAGFPISSPGDFESVKLIAQKVRRPIICGLARAHPKDIDRAWEAVKGAKRPRIHVFVSSSDIHLMHGMKKTREEILQLARDMVARAKGYTDDIEFSPMDASRTEPAYLYRILELAIDAGATTVNIPDTVGYAIPEEFGRLIEGILKNVPNIKRAVVSVHCHNDLGLAVANSLAGVRYGARQVHVCVNGLGERAGNASLDEVVLGLMAFYGVRTNVDTTKLSRVSKTIARMTGFTLADNKPIVGRNAFAHESGIHVHGVLRDPSTYEAFSPELVGMQREIVVGKHTGTHSVKQKLAQYGVEVTDEQLAKIVDHVKRLAESGKHVDDAELVALASHFAGQDKTPRRIKLKEFAVFTGVNITPTAVVAVDVDGEVRRGSKIGIGPVDAALNAIRSVLKDSVSLEEYRLSAITGGSDALCEVSVKMRLDDDGQVMSVGKSVGSDIVNTSVEATIEAIDRLYLRKMNLGKENIGK